MSSVLRYRMTLRDCGPQVELCRRLGMSVEPRRSNGDIVVRCGEEALELRVGEHDEGRITTASALGFQHLAIVVRDVDRVLANLPNALVRLASRRPETLPTGIRAVYLRGPEGHYLELISFPPGIGDHRWQHGPTDRAIGLDHSAIGVADTMRSLAFWRDDLGLVVIGESFNHGVEQASLANVAGAAVRITSLRGESGSGVELLEYVSPARALEPPRARKPGWTILVDETMDGASKLDPDGHAVDVLPKGEGGES